MTNSVRLVIRPALAQTLGLDANHSKLECSLAPGESLADVLARLADENPAIARRVYDREERRVNSLVQISINGRLLSLVGGVETTLRDGDEVLIFYAAAGG